MDLHYNFPNREEIEVLKESKLKRKQALKESKLTI